MHELSMCDIGIGAKNESFSICLKDLNVSKFSDIWTIADTTHNNFLAHELKGVLNF
jgi:hypothetical protein